MMTMLLLMLATNTNTNANTSTYGPRRQSGRAGGSHFDDVG